MTLDQLQMLVRISDTGSVLAAAETLHRTQPTISVGIRKLEEDLGLKLLARDQYRARLTPAGEKICQQAREVLRQGTFLKDLAGHLASGNEPKVAIAIEESCPIPLVLKVLKSFELKYPHTEFELVGERLWGALERLEQAEADLIITPWFEENVHYQSFPLSKIRMIPVAAPGFLPGKSGQLLKLADLKDKVQVVVRDSSRIPRRKSLGVTEAGRHWLVNDHHTKKEILLAGMGWGRLQEHLVRPELENGRLVELRIDDFSDTSLVEIRVARRRGESIGPVATDLWDAFEHLKIGSNTI